MSKTWVGLIGGAVFAILYWLMREDDPYDAYLTEALYRSARDS
jgi:hypothetical protein